MTQKDNAVSFEELLETYMGLFYAGIQSSVDIPDDEKPYGLLQVAANGSMLACQMLILNELKELNHTLKMNNVNLNYQPTGKLH